ncbi:MAG: general stress protein CsbD [Burkholderiales bacterium]
MKWKQIEGDWLQFKNNVKRQWPKLTYVDVIIGKRSRLAHYIQKRVGCSHGEAEQQLAIWQARQSEVCQPV